MKKAILILAVTLLASVSLGLAVARAEGETPTSTPLPLPTATPTPAPNDLEWTPDQIQAAGGPRVAIDQQIESLLPVLIEKQNAYKQGGNGRYFQGKSTHSFAPKNANTYPDRWFDHPTDQASSWKHFGAFGYQAQLFAIRIDTVDGPNGQGWVACFRAEIDGIEQERCDGYGEGAALEHGWQITAGVEVQP